MTKPKLISLFSGAGGMDYGFEAAGFETAVTVEFDHDCCETLRANRPWHVIERDIFKVPTAEMLEAARAKPGEIDLLIGGPPCQPFSKAGYWAHGDAKRLEDPRADTLGAYLRVIREAKPRAFVLENVEGLAYSKKDEGLRLLLDAIEQINRATHSRYRPQYRVLNAARYGVPQLRQRLFLIAARDGTTFRFPEPTHHDPSEREGDLLQEPFRTAWDALADVGPAKGEDLGVRGKWAELLPSIPEGQNYLWHTDRMGGLPLFGWRRRYWSFLLKLAKARPSWTIQAQPGPAVGPFHWSNRRLSLRELCRIQTFPDDVNVTGQRGAAQKQVGNAVPSLLTEVIGKEVRRQLLGERVPRSGHKLMPPKRRTAPSEEPVEIVPSYYRRLAGSHSAHPGTGRGAGARRHRRMRRQSA